MGKCMKELVDRLCENRGLSSDEMTELLKFRNRETAEYLFERAREVKQKHYGKKIFIRGTVEIGNYCKNDCYYCGLRRGNIFITRYRLEEDEILEYCGAGYEKGIRTFVLIGGDDYFYTGERVAGIVSAIREKYPDCAVELGLGERPGSVYRLWFEAGASRYLLWHETASDSHFRKLHPPEMSLLKRKQALWDLKDMGYQVGTGFMVGMPYQSVANVVEDLEFIKALDPHMAHIVPFLPTAHTRFEKERSGNGDMTLYIMAIVRLMLPRALISADPILEGVLFDARKKAIGAGANEVFASLAPDEVRGYYNVCSRRLAMKSSMGDDVGRVATKIEESGNVAASERGDYEFPNESEGVNEKIRYLMRS